MDLAFDIEVLASEGKSVIAPLVVTVKDAAGNTAGTVTSNGHIQFSDEFLLNATGQEKTFTVSVAWPSNDLTDINYAGANYGSAVKVSVTGTQK
jgi:predicted ester cyclase